MSHCKQTQARRALKHAMCEEILSSPNSTPGDLAIMIKAQADTGQVRFYREPCKSLRDVHRRVTGTDPHDDYLRF